MACSALRRGSERDEHEAYDCGSRPGLEVSSRASSFCTGAGSFTDEIAAGCCRRRRTSGEVRPDPAGLHSTRGRRMGSTNRPIGLRSARSEVISEPEAGMVRLRKMGND
jgi:hypothetical protein